MIPGPTPEFMKCPKCGQEERRSAMKYSKCHGKYVMQGVFVCVNDSRHKPYLWESGRLPDTEMGEK